MDGNGTELKHDSFSYCMLGISLARVAFQRHREVVLYPFVCLNSSYTWCYGFGPFACCQAKCAMAIACHRLRGWSATFGDSSEACLSCQKTMKDKPQTQSQKVTNQKPKPTSATSQCQIKKLFRRGSKRGTLHC